MQRDALVDTFDIHAEPFAVHGHILVLGEFDIGLELIYGLARAHPGHDGASPAILVMARFSAFCAMAAPTVTQTAAARKAAQSRAVILYMEPLLF